MATGAHPILTTQQLAAAQRGGDIEDVGNAGKNGNQSRHPLRCRLASQHRQQPFRAVLDWIHGKQSPAKQTINQLHAHY